MFKLIMIIMLVTGSGDLQPQMDIREMGEFDTKAECVGAATEIKYDKTLDFGKAYDGWYDSQVPKLHIKGKCVQTRSASAKAPAIKDQTPMIKVLKDRIKELEKGNGAKW